ncbi:MAG: glutathione S-transferase family protein [Gaiellaceae bacterium]
MAHVLRLYDYAASANCYKARLLLAQLGRDYERVAVDIFAGDTTTPAYRAKNPAGRTPVLELDSGETIAESNAILLYLGEGTSFVPDELHERARVWQWLFFEQNLFEPNVGTARFWRLTGRDALHPGVFAARLESAAAAVATLDAGLAGRDFLVGDRHTVADVSLYAYAHVAHEAGIDTGPHRDLGAWLARVEATDGFVNDLEPYPENARPGAGGSSVHG